MKKLLAIFLCLVMSLLAFVGCDGDKKDNESDKSVSSSEASSVEASSKEESASSEEVTSEEQESSLENSFESEESSVSEESTVSEESSVESGIVVELSETELDEIESFLNDVKNNGFISYNYYTKPQDINLRYVFYDGAGIAIPKSDWAEGEAEAVLNATGWEEFFVAPTKITFEDADALLTKKCGISLLIFGWTPKIDGYIYVEEFNSFYVLRTDTNYCPVDVSDGRIIENGDYVINYTSALYQGQSFTVTLKKVDGGYQFISNIRND